MRKGQKVSEDTKEKYRKTMFKKLISKYNWKLVEPYLDVEIKNGSVKRTKKYITFRGFKKRIEQGINLDMMIEEGISHHFLAFLNNFCQGKIKLEKEEFIKEYEKGLLLDKISKIYKITREDLTYLRQLYGIKRKGANFIKRKKTEIPLTQRQKEILYGTMMGDAKALSPSAAHFKHSIKQKEYLFWKWEEFKNLCNGYNLKKYSQYDKRYNKFYTGWSFYTKANTDIEECIKEFYKSGTKEVTKKILEHLTPLSIAVWFQDDGYADRNKNGYISNFIFCTDSFSKESCDLIIKWFKDKYSIESHLRKRKLKNRIGYRIVINSETMFDFMDLIESYILLGMKYKIKYKIENKELLRINSC